MNVFLLFGLGLASVCTAHAYVYVQVQKGDKDMSNVDALIHKQVPSGSVGQIADQLKDTFQKKQTHNKYKRFEVRKRADDDQPSSKESAEVKKNLENVMLAVGSVGQIADQLKDTFQKKQTHNKYMRFEVRKRADDDQPSSIESAEVKKNLENVMLAVDTGASPEPWSKSGGGAAASIIDQLLGAVKDFGKEGHPMYRAREEYNIKPEVVHFSSGKPSLKFEVNSDSIVKLAKELLASPTIKRYADELAQKAAVLFKVIKDEMKKPN